MNLPDRLISWAQNEEMIDSYFLMHGRDCLDAAEKLRNLEARPVHHPLVWLLAVIILVTFGGSMTIYGLFGQVSTLRAENAQLQARTCTPSRMETPTIIQRERKVIG